MADAALVATGAGAAPLSYKVPGAAVIRIKQVHVAYTDNGAGADWLPMVRIVSDSNHTMGQAADQAVKVTAGSDAAVTFHPGVKHAAASAGAATLPSCVCDLDIGTGVFANGIHYLPIATLRTDTPSIFSTAGGGTPNVDIGADGFYMIAGRLSLNPATDLNFFLSLQGHGDGATGWTADLDVIPADNTRRQNVSFLGGVTFSTMTATDTISLSMQCDLGISGVTGAGLEITRLSTTRIF